MTPHANTSPAPGAHTSHSIEAAGLKLHYLDYGTAGRPPMLCVHGGAAHGHWFDFVAPAFSADYHVRAIDQRGHGDSGQGAPADYTYDRYAADLNEVVEKLGLRDFVLVGHSMGGMVSVVYAATYPGRLAKLIVIDSLLRMQEDRVAALRGVGSREGSSYASQAEFIERYRLRPAGTRATPEVIRHLAQHGARQFPDGRWRHKFDRNVYATREPWEGLPFWARIKVPVQLIKGALSPRLSPEIVAEIRARCPQVEFVEIPDSDHHVTLDQPAACAQAMRAFLNK
ncbi:MAG: alpha/beta fold hydrolase [Burkholderiales bacterium]